MNSKNNRVLVGIILLLLGIGSLIQGFININYGGIYFAIVGVALVMLYKTKGKSWSLILGSYCIYFGAISFLSDLLSSNFSSIVGSTAFFIVPGVIFIILYLQRNKKGLLVPGSLLLWFGIYVFLGYIDILEWISGSLFFVCLGLSFLTIYFLSKEKRMKWAFNLGIALIILGVLSAIDFSFFTSIFNSVPFIASIAVIIIAIIIIFSAFYTKKKKDEREN